MNNNPFAGFEIIDCYSADDALEDGFMAELPGEVIPPERGRGFDLGRCLATPGVLEQVKLEEIREALARHASGDWGEMDADDSAANDQALVDGSRIFSAYRTGGAETFDVATGTARKTAKGIKFWIITDGADDDGKRHNTTVMLPEEY